MRRITREQYLLSDDPVTLMRGIRVTPRQIFLAAMRLFDGLRPDFVSPDQGTALDLLWRHANIPDESCLDSALDLVMGASDRHGVFPSDVPVDPTVDSFFYLMRLLDVFRNGCDAHWFRAMGKGLLTMTNLCHDLSVHLGRDRPAGSWSALMVGSAVREVLGDPFRPLSIPQHADQDVRRVAEEIHRSPDLTDLPILADALEDAGFDDRDVLDRIRLKVRRRHGWFVLDACMGLPQATRK